MATINSDHRDTGESEPLNHTPNGSPPDARYLGRDSMRNLHQPINEISQLAYVLIVSICIYGVITVVLEISHRHQLISSLTSDTAQLFLVSALVLLMVRTMRSVPTNGKIKIAVLLFAICAFANRILDLTDEISALDTVMILGDNGWQHQTIRSVLRAMTTCSIFITISLLFQSLRAACSRMERQADEKEHLEERMQRLRAELAHVTRLSTMGEMATGIAHELNQPLSAIATYAYSGQRMLSDHPSTESQPLADVVQKIADQSMRAGEIIRRYRSLIQNNDPECEWADMNELVREVVALLETEIGRRKIRLELQLDPAISEVNVDCVQIQQVLINLVMNAFDAMDEADADRRLLSIVTSARNDDDVEVAIRDAGTGVSAEHVQYVTEPFFSTKPQGMGMGLAISQTIVEAHDGRLTFEPNRDGGTTVRFTVPAMCGGELRNDRLHSVPHRV